MNKIKNTNFSTFSNKKPETLQFKELEEIYKLLFVCGKPQLSMIFENLSKDKMDLFKKNTEVKDFILYGWPVLKRAWMPKDEMWFVDKDGRVIRRFKFK